MHADARGKWEGSTGGLEVEAGLGRMVASYVVNGVSSGLPRLGGDWTSVR